MSTSKPRDAVSGIARAEIRLPSTDLKADLPFFTNILGFRLDMIFPADDPATAVISGHGVRIRLERGASEAPGTLRLLCDPGCGHAPGGVFEAPNGTRIEIAQADPPLVIPETAHSYSVRRLVDSDAWVIGRAGMHYRDLIPGRLGGSIIASHIRIPGGGPVPDMVHYHTVGFQLIFCHAGWVRLVYEDQGPPFILAAGDCVIQPPEIRHRVLESSDNLEVIEIGVPAEHVTTIDHEMELPNDRIDPERDFSGTHFCHHELADAIWQDWRIPGFEARDTGIADATGGLAGVQVARAVGEQVRSGATPVTIHDADILFGFVRQGSMNLCADGHQDRSVTTGDAFVIPPGLATSYTDISADFELLEVSLPGRFETRMR